MSEAGVTQVQFSAVIDHRTSEVCLQMNGRIFTIEQAKTNMDNILGQDSIEGLKTVAPWFRDLSSFGVGAGEKLTDSITSSRLAEAGVIIPPLHFRCRSEIVPA